MAEVPEICPGCGCAHVGFSPRETQQRTFWQCRKCALRLVTLRDGDGWKVHNIHGKTYGDLMNTPHRDLPYFRDIYEMIRSFGTFIAHPLLQAITRATEDAADRKAFYETLSALHVQFEVPLQQWPRA